jgi:hypothetical protein
MLAASYDAGRRCGKMKRIGGMAGCFDGHAGSSKFATWNIDNDVIYIIIEI